MSVFMIIWIALMSVGGVGIVATGYDVVHEPNYFREENKRICEANGDHGDRIKWRRMADDTAAGWHWDDSNRECRPPYFGQPKHWWEAKRKFSKAMKKWEADNPGLKFTESNPMPQYWWQE